MYLIIKWQTYSNTCYVTICTLWHMLPPMSSLPVIFSMHRLPHRGLQYLKQLWMLCEMQSLGQREKSIYISYFHLHSAWSKVFANASYFICRARPLQSFKFYICLNVNLNIKYYLYISHNIQSCFKYCKPRCVRLPAWWPLFKLECPAALTLEEGPDFVGRDLVYNVYWFCDITLSFSHNYKLWVTNKCRFFDTAYTGKGKAMLIPALTDNHYQSCILQVIVWKPHPHPPCKVVNMNMSLKNTNLTRDASAASYTVPVPPCVLSRCSVTSFK